MNIKMACHLFVALVLSVLDQMLVSAADEALVFSDTFDVEPGGEVKTFSGHGDGLKCEFTYACQGGTLEEWEMSIKHEKDGHYRCVVERPEGHSHSYLYFTEFRLKVSGGIIREAVVFGKDPHEPGDQDEYKVHKHYVENTDDFKHALNRVSALVSRKKHHEL